MLLFIEPPFSDPHPIALAGEGSETSVVKISGQTFRLSRVSKQDQHARMAESSEWGSLTLENEALWTLRSAERSLASWIFIQKRNPSLRK